MKRNFTLYLTEENVEKAREYLSKADMSLSSYIDNLLKELVIAFESKPGSSIFEKKMGDVTLSEFKELLGRMLEVDEDVTEKKK